MQIKKLKNVIDDLGSKSIVPIATKIERGHTATTETTNNLLQNLRAKYWMALNTVLTTYSSFKPYNLFFIGLFLCGSKRQEISIKAARIAENNLLEPFNERFSNLLYFF